MCFPDVDECAQDMDNCDNSSSTCEDTIGSFICVCKAGYSLNGTVCTGEKF